MSITNLLKEILESNQETLVFSCKLFVVYKRPFKRTLKFVKNLLQTLILESFKRFSEGCVCRLNSEKRIGIQKDKKRKPKKKKRTKKGIKQQKKKTERKNSK